MTACDFITLWDGTPSAVYGEELLPPRAERTSLPVDRDRARDTAQRKVDALPMPTTGRACQCGCGGILREPKRRQDGRLRCRERGIRFIHGHHMKGTRRS